jgi:hypothetical protein
MAKAYPYTETVIIFELSEREASLVRDLVQNSTVENEPSNIAALRKDIFDALHEALRK